MNFTKTHIHRAVHHVFATSVVLGFIATPVFLVCLHKGLLPAVLIDSLSRRGQPMMVTPQEVPARVLKRTTSLQEMVAKRRAQRGQRSSATSSSPSKTKLRALENNVVSKKNPSPLFFNWNRSSAGYTGETFHGAAGASSAAAAVVPMPEGFPAFGIAVFPVTHVPHWGAMHSPAEWNRTYTQMTAKDFVPLPPYDLRILTIPMQELQQSRNPATNAVITAKLTYSTRHFGKYDLDAGEYTGTHAGVDLKLALGTPIGVIAGGRVVTVAENDRLGLHVVVEHRHPTEGVLFSVYGHMGTTSVQEGQDVAPGTILGTVGMTGNTTAPHLHLQLDRDNGSHPHEQFMTRTALNAKEANVYALNPITFITKNASGVPEAFTKVDSLPY